MKQALLLSSLVVGLALVGCSKSPSTSSKTASNDTLPPAPASSADSMAKSADAMAKNAGDTMRSAAGTVAVTARQIEWKLTNDDIKDDVAAGRTIERSKAGAPTGGTFDRSNLKDAVKARFHDDGLIAGMPIDIDADRDGQINLSGKANTIDQVGRAIALALDTDGVTKVASKIKLDKEANAHQ